jgi:hypothetical protein
MRCFEEPTYAVMVHKLYVERVQTFVYGFVVWLVTGTHSVSSM